MIKELLAGAALLGRGLALVLGRRRLFLLAAIPPLIVSVAFFALLIALVTNLGGIVPALSGFADDGGTGLKLAVQLGIGLGLVGGASMIMVLVFTPITLMVGAPLYDKIGELAEEELGDVPAPVQVRSQVASVWRSIRQSLALLAVTLTFALVFAVLGFVPLVGQSVIPVLAVIFGGWMLCLELLAPAFERRGLVRISDRRKAMQEHRWRSLGLAIPTFVLLAIPLVSVLVFPAAAASGTMLTRALLSGRPEPTDVGPESVTAG